MKRRLFLPLILTLASPALAQDGTEAVANRTPANAQKFIATLSPYVLAVGGRYLLVRSMTSADACSTRIAGPAADFDGAKNDFLAKPGDVEDSTLLDWSKVEDIKSADWDVTTYKKLFYISFLTPNGAEPKGMTVYFTVAPSRDRVLAAAQYLKQACDKTKELGF